MANTSAPRGLVPVRRAHGGTANFGLRKYYVPSSDGTALFIGDPVQLAGSADATGFASVTRATAAGGNYICGVVVGIDSPTYGGLPYRAASTAGYVLVDDDPDTLYEIQEDAVGGALAAADIGLNADLIAGSGNTNTGLSGWQLDTSTKATTNTLQLKIVDIVQRPDNELSANSKVHVRINLHQYRNTTGIS